MSSALSSLESPHYFWMFLFEVYIFGPIKWNFTWHFSRRCFLKSFFEQQTKFYIFKVTGFWIVVHNWVSKLLNGANAVQPSKISRLFFSFNIYLCYDQLYTLGTVEPHYNAHFGVRSDISLITEQPYNESLIHRKFKSFATGDAYMRQLFHCLQWYAGSERVKAVGAMPVECYKQMSAIKEGVIMKLQCNTNNNNNLIWWQCQRVACYKM